MEYAIKPLTNFIGYTDKSPLTKKEYQVLSHPQGGGSTSPIALDTVNLSTGGGRDALIKSLTSGYSSPNLLGSLVPSAAALGGSYGLYAGVGEVPYYKMKSLIDQYV